MNQIPFITKYEKTRVIGTRAEQLAKGAKPLTNIGELNSPVKIAEKEYKEGVIPISIKRTLPNGQILILKIHPKKI